MTVLKAIALAIALATSASTWPNPEPMIQQDPIDATWAQELG